MSLIDYVAAALQPFAQLQLPAEDDLENTGETDELLKKSLEDFDSKYVRLAHFGHSEPKDYSDWWLCIPHDKINKASGPEELETLKREIRMIKICRGRNSAFLKLGTEVRRLHQWKISRLPNVEEKLGEDVLKDPSAYALSNLDIPITLRQLERHRKEYLPIEFISYMFLELGQAIADCHRREVALNGLKKREVLLYPSDGTVISGFPAVIITKCDDFQFGRSFNADRPQGVKAFCTVIYDLLVREAGKDASRFKGYASFKEALEDGSEKNLEDTSKGGDHKALDDILQKHSLAAKECLKNVTDVMKLRVSTEILNVRNNYAAADVDGKLRDAIEEAKGKPATSDSEA